MDREELALEYLEQLPFQPYPFQEEAVCSWFSSEQGVLVCAPTGMGKTLIAEAGLYEALKTGKKAYYTTPLIALTEQKYREIQETVQRWGYDHSCVGLVTGNRRTNPDAQILVVVAEILFNRLLHQQTFSPDVLEMFNGSLYDSKEKLHAKQSSIAFDDVSVVVMDEFHNFADHERGIVWEFTLGLLPPHIRTLLISATVGNAYEFIAWLRTAHNRKLLLIESTERKVPLTFRWVGDELLVEQIEKMHEAGTDEARLTPALVFCFDRNECWDVADQIRGRNVITADRQKILAGLLEKHDFTQGAGPKLKQLLLRGIGVHHAGVLPKYRRIVEDLFQQKLLSICVCTETLAAGINLPARSVVLPTLMKGPQGEKKLIDSSTAHQIFGRAGRPQYDSQGFVFALAHEDDVKIARFKEKYDQIPEDTKDPKLREMKKKLKKKMPTRRTTEQYWVEANFINLQKSPPAKLTSRGEFPWRLLAHIIASDPDIATIRKLVAKRLMGSKRLEAGQKELDQMLLTLWKTGFIQLDPEPVTDTDSKSFGDNGTTPNTEVKAEAKTEAKAAIENQRIPANILCNGTKLTFSDFGGCEIFNNQTHKISGKEPTNGRRNTSREGHRHTVLRYDFGSGKLLVNSTANFRLAPNTSRAYPREKLPELLKLRGANPLYGLFLLEHFGKADTGERLQMFESLLELPTSLGPAVRVPSQRDLPPGQLAQEYLDPLLLELGLASVDELIEKSDEEKQEEWEKRKKFGGFAEEPVFVLKLAEKLKRLFEYEYPGVNVRINPVWAAGEIILEFKGDFNKYITSAGLQKQEGIVFRHLLRLILLLSEFSEITPAEMDAEEWQNELTALGAGLLECCRKVDPASTDEAINRAASNI